MRESLLNNFNKLWFDCMNGASRETGKLTPEGKPDPSVFSTKYNKAGITVGTTVGLMLRTEERKEENSVLFRHFWGVGKKTDLLESLKEEDFNSRYKRAVPTVQNWFSFRTMDVAVQYYEWPKVTDLSAMSPLNGPVERRGNSLIAMCSEPDPFNVLKAYLDPKRTDQELASLEPRFMKSSGEFDAEKTRSKLKGVVSYDEKNIYQYPFKPLDARIAYLDPDIQPLFSRPSPDLLSFRSIPANSFFITRDSADKAEEGPPFYYSPLVCDYDSISGHARHFPIFVRAFSKTNGKGGVNGELFEDKPIANLSEKARNYLAHLAIDEPDRDLKSAPILWLHCLAIGYSSGYLTQNRDGIAQGWPRIPLPDVREKLMQSADLGWRVAHLLDTGKDVHGVTAGPVRPELAVIGVPFPHRRPADSRF
ncbi:MAG: type ISP restriction/modification enzyme [Desulfomonilaceae bacterium]